MSAFQRQESHPRNFTFPLAPRRPPAARLPLAPVESGGRAPGRGGGAARPPPTAQTWFGILRPPGVVAHSQPTRAAAGWPASNTVSTLQQLAPAPAGKAAASGGPLQSKKGPGAFQFPAAAGGAALRPRGRALPPHLHTSRPPRSTQQAWCGLPISSAYYPPTSSAYRT